LCDLKYVFYINLLAYLGESTTSNRTELSVVVGMRAASSVAARCLRNEPPTSGRPP
jgi:hypothetical protein